MTEAEWLAATDPESLLVWLQFAATARPSRRKLALASSGWARQVGRRIRSELIARAFHLTERGADGSVGQGDVAAFLSEFYGRGGGDDLSIGLAAVRILWPHRVEEPPEESVGFVSRWAAVYLRPNSRADILRDVIGNPFRPASLDPSWVTSTVVSLARQMYASRDYSAMPILADALQDAGCDSTDVLAHCRGPGPHIRGCWVVDLVLSKG
jgi:hypothetical protein